MEILITVLLPVLCLTVTVMLLLVPKYHFTQLLDSNSHDILHGLAYKDILRMDMDILCIVLYSLKS